MLYSTAVVIATSRLPGCHAFGLGHLASPMGIPGSSLSNAQACCAQALGMSMPIRCIPVRNIAHTRRLAMNMRRILGTGTL